MNFTKPSLIFLGAGKPHCNYRLKIDDISYDRLSIITWLRSLFEGLVDKEICVLGFEGNEIKENHRNLVYVENSSWEGTTAGASMLLGLSEVEHDAVVTYTDVIYRHDLVKELLQSSPNFDIVLAVDAQWSHRYSKILSEPFLGEFVSFRGSNILSVHSEYRLGMSDAEFCGLMYLSKSAVKFLKTFFDENKHLCFGMTLIEIIELCRAKGLSIGCVDVQSDWAECNDPRDVARFVMGTKAETLHRLHGRLRNSKILEQISFTVDQWQSEKSQIIDRVISKFGSRTLAVRSSSKAEDTFAQSSAGLYESVLGVTSSAEKIHEAVTQVINSFHKSSSEDQVLIQPMLSDVVISGVCFTRALSDLAPYYVVNFDDTSGRTDTITSGTSSETRLYKIYRGCDQLDGHPQWLKNLLAGVREIENLVGLSELDIEFAFNKSDQLTILQVRPLTVTKQNLQEFDCLYDEQIQTIYRETKELLCRKDHLLGESTVLGTMPDWNPAEIIGACPNNISYDLYHSLITDEVWALQRAQYGYRDVRPFSLMRRVGSKPYVDCRAIFNSYIPANLSDDLATRLVEFYLSSLKKNPQFHDKIEFEIVKTCFTLDQSVWSKKLRDAGFETKDINKINSGLLDITRNAIKRYPKKYDDFNELDRRVDNIMREPISKRDKIKYIIENIKLLGTINFAHFARDGFVAVDLLRSGLSTGILSEDTHNYFISQINTVTSDFKSDMDSYRRNKVNIKELLQKYGHLRPDTYNIMSEKYADNPNIYFHKSKELVKNEMPFKPHNYDDQINKFFDAITQASLTNTSKSAQVFLQESIIGREKSKFLFTRNLSILIDLIRDLSEEIGIDLQEISSFSLNTLLGSNVAGSYDLTSSDFKIIGSTSTPDLIFSENDLLCFEEMQSVGNYISLKSITGELIQYSRYQSPSDFDGRIVLIESADPGYDWIFNYRIAGLITMYGGANSHMAIRCAELNIPAIIGVGGVKFTDLLKSNSVYLDCRNKKLEILS